MPFFDDFTNAVNNYPATYVTLSIVDLAIQSGTPGAVNVNEVWRFQVRVRNNGPLDMTGVSLHIHGLNGATVSTLAAGPFSGAITFGNLTVNAHGGQQDTVNLFFKAPNTAKPAGTDLVKAHIQGWNGSLNHILQDHSGAAEPPAAIYENQVFP